MNDLFAFILKRAEEWSDVCVFFLFALGGASWVIRAQWRQAKAVRNALQASQEAHEADLRTQMAASEARAAYFQKQAEGFRAGASILRPFVGK